MYTQVWRCCNLAGEETLQRAAGVSRQVQNVRRLRGEHPLPVLRRRLHDEVAWHAARPPAGALLRQLQVCWPQRGDRGQVPHATSTRPGGRPQLGRELVDAFEGRKVDYVLQLQVVAEILHRRFQPVQRVEPQLATCTGGVQQVENVFRHPVEGRFALDRPREHRPPADALGETLVRELVLGCVAEACILAPQILQLGQAALGPWCLVDRPGDWDFAAGDRRRKRRGRVVRVLQRV